MNVVDAFFMQAFNRTSLELKLINRKGIVERGIRLLIAPVWN